jgi:hypothetical protein
MTSVHAAVCDTKLSHASLACATCYACMLWLMCVLMHAAVLASHVDIRHQHQRVLPRRVRCAGARADRSNARLAMRVALRIQPLTYDLYQCVCGGWCVARAGGRSCTAHRSTMSDSLTPHVSSSPRTRMWLTLP